MKTKIVKVEPLQNAQYIKTYLMHYEQEGIQKNWEILESHDSVSVLLYNVDEDAFILVKQLRPAVLYKAQLEGKEIDGKVYELCAGLVDKDKSLVQIAKEEILEECGYEVPLETIERVTQFQTNVGMSGAVQTMFYAEISNSMKVSEGGGIEDEVIEVIMIKRSDVKDFMFDENYAKTPAMIAGFYWFFDKKSLRK